MDNTVSRVEIYTCKSKAAGMGSDTSGFGPLCLVLAWWRHQALLKPAECDVSRLKSVMMVIILLHQIVYLHGVIVSCLIVLGHALQFDLQSDRQRRFLTWIIHVNMYTPLAALSDQGQ